MKFMFCCIGLYVIGCGEQTVKVVNTVPNVSILSPNENAQFVIGQTVNFEAIVDDAQQSADTLNLTWLSDLDGDLSTTPASGNGEVQFSTINLSLGNHLITLRAIDNNAEVGEDQRIVHIVEPEPEYNETANKEGGVFCSAGGVVSGGDLSGSFAWPLKTWRQGQCPPQMEWYGNQVLL